MATFAIEDRGRRNTCNSISSWYRVYKKTYTPSKVVQSPMTGSYF